MERVVTRFGDRYFVWLVAVLAIGDSLASSAGAFVDGRYVHVAIWLVAALAMCAAASVVEIVKTRRGD